MNFLFKDINLENSFLDFLRIKDRVIASNIANAETPFYKRLKVELVNNDSEIPLKTTLPGHISNKSPNPFVYKIVQDSSGLVGNDRNNVSVEKEMVELEKVALKYETVLKFVQGKIGSLDMVIKGFGG